jgi:hypothetical protein
MIWLETKTPEDAKRIQDRIWGMVLPRETADGAQFDVRGEGLYEAGDFWANAIRKLKDNPHERLKMAKRHLPLPAAFREAAIALRAIITQNRKQNADYKTALNDLYHLAAIWSFCILYATRLKQPGFNVLASVPFSEFERMSLTWETLGYEKLELLTKSDCKLMVEVWGEPQAHNTAHLKYKNVWDRYEDMLIESGHQDGGALT